MNVRIFLTLLVLMLLGVLPFTTSSLEPQQSKRVITVEISGFKYNPDPITLEPGETVTFEVTNKDSAPHTFTVDGDELLDLAPGASGSADYTAPSTEQTFEITCRYHPSMGADLVIETSGKTDSSIPSDSAGNSTSDSGTTDSTSVPADSTNDNATPFPVVFLLFAFVTIAVLRRRTQ